MDNRRRFFNKDSSISGESSGSYTVFLNGQWQKSTTISNPDSTLYEGVYESFSNKGTNNSGAIMYIDIDGYTNFKLYIRSYAESNYDYVMVSQLDQIITYSTSYSNTTLIKANTRGNQKSGTTINDYTLVEFANIDGGSHRISIIYRKDSSTHSNDDRGYVLIPLGQGSVGEGGDDGEVDIDTTYSIMYTSSDGNIVTPYKTDVFGANIISNNYVNGQGIISFDGPVTTIGDSAFYYCTSLTSVTIPDNVTTIGEGAFRDCTSLTSVTIGNRVTTIGNLTFYYCTSLTSVTIPDSVTTIEVLAFAYCTNLISITIPDSVTTIGSRTFYYCTSLTSVTIPDSVTSIGNAAFAYCTNLTEFNGKFASEDGRCLIVEGLLNSFAIGCGATEYTIPNSVTTIGDSAFRYCLSLTSVTIPDSVTTIGQEAFRNCDSLTSVTIGDSVTTIGDSAFFGCKSLTSVTIPDGVTEIGYNAFREAKVISITIPNSVTRIESYAFYSCSLSSVYCAATTPPVLGNDYVFDNNSTSRKIYVPTESVETYKSATYWKEYARAIEGYNF